MSADPAAAPSGVVTFLFTDVEGSTRRWEADADGMRVALAAHDEVLRAAIEAHGGWLFKHTGDGVCAAFASPKCAVDAAVARSGRWSCRCGWDRDRRSRAARGGLLRCGAQSRRAGDGRRARRSDPAGRVDGGPAQRSGSSRSGAAAVTGSADCGRGVQVRAAGLRTDFPPLRALDANPGNLRPAVTSFIGRESEIAEIQAAVRAHRLVTLTGVGGVGKTRLATEVAARLADEFPDGVWLFELAAVADPAAVPDAVAAVLGITQQPGKSVCESVAAALEGRVRLLVLDNCEHVRDAAADLVEAILAHSATVRVWPPAAKVWASPTSNYGRCCRWMSARESTLPQSICLSNVPGTWRRASRWPGLTRRLRWWRSAVASTDFCWPSSWRPRGWRR